MFVLLNWLEHIYIYISFTKPVKMLYVSSMKSLLFIIIISARTEVSLRLPIIHRKSQALNYSPEQNNRSKFKFQTLMSLSNNIISLFCSQTFANAKWKMISSARLRVPFFFFFFTTFSFLLCQTHCYCWNVEVIYIYIWGRFLQ